MKRLVPVFVFILIAAGLVAFINKDRLSPQSEESRKDSSHSGNAGGRSGSSGGSGGFRRRPDIVPVTVDKVKTDQVPVYLSGVGTVQAFNTATVRTQVSGRLIEVAFKEGQDVKAGDVLSRIDPALYQAAYDQAVAKKASDSALLANARLDEARYTNLAKSNNASQQQADTATANVRQYEGQVRQDQAAIDNAKANLDYCTIKAPFNGRTGLRLIDIGNLVSSADSTGIVVITQLQPIAIVFTLPQNFISDVLAAQSKANLELEAFVNEASLGKGQLNVIDNQIDQSTGTFKLKGTFANEQYRLWPGQFVNVKLKLKTLENAIVVPSVAIQEGSQGSFVYVVTPDNTVKFTAVKVVQEGPYQAVISQGVSPGETIVTNGFASLTDGTKVKADTQAGASASENTSTNQGSAPSGSDSSGEHRHKQNKNGDSGTQTPDSSEHHGQGKKRRQGSDSSDAATPSTPSQVEANTQGSKVP